MAGFEIIVRPVVFPDIRPQATRSLPPEDDPEKGKCTIGGSGGGLIGVSYSSSMSASRASQKEKKREVDEARVYQQEDNGAINQDNFVDIQVAKKIYMESKERTAGGSSEPVAGNKNAVPAGGETKVTTKYNYIPVRPTANIEIMKEGQWIKVEG